MAQRLTDKFVRDLIPPAKGYKIYWDDVVPGFGIRITAADAKAFVFDYRFGSRQPRPTIGRYPAWSVAAAREEAKNLRRAVDRGEDPQGDKNARRAAPTVADLCDRYEEDHLPRKRASSRRGDKAMIRLHILPRLGKLKVADAAFSNIDALHRALKAKPYQANRVLALLSKMFNLAEKWGYRPQHTNPCRGVERYQEIKRIRYLSGPERVALLVAMQEHAAAGAVEAQTVRAFRLAMLTGARIGEVLGARWSDFDIAEGRWTKPGATTKQKTVHNAKVNAPARQLLSEMQAARPNSQWVFPSPADEGHQRGYKHSWQAIRRLATIELWRRSDKPEAGGLIADLEKGLGRTPTYAEATAAARKLGIKLPAGLLTFRVHDLRHSFASEGAAAGLSLPMIGALLGHTNPATTARYAHLLDDPLKAAAEKIGSRIAGGSEREVS